MRITNSFFSILAKLKYNRFYFHNFYSYCLRVILLHKQQSKNFINQSLKKVMSTWNVMLYSTDYFKILTRIINSIFAIVSKLTHNEFHFYDFYSYFLQIILLHTQQRNFFVYLSKRSNIVTFKQLNETMTYLCK